MSDIFREVDEALQQEKAAKVWKEYGPTLIAGAFIVVLATGATTAFKAWNHSRNADETSRLVTALEETNPSPATLLDIAKDTRGNHESLALFTAAGLVADKKDYAPAAALYKQVFETGGTPSEISGLARVLYVRNVLAAGGDANADELLAALKPVLNDEGNAWRWPAKIDAALIAAHLQQDYKSAAAHLQGTDTATDLPPSLKQRAESLYQLYTAKIPAEPKKDTQG